MPSFGISAKTSRLPGQITSGCLFEIAQREVLTLFGDPERGRRYVEIAKECVEQYRQP